jgi:hypothetical protein
MNKLTKGALAMVLAGSLTFSITNALLVHQSSKRLAEENALTISGVQKKADVINPAEKTVIDQKPTTNGKGVQTKLSHNIAAFQVALKNKNKSDMTIASVQQNTEKSTERTTTNPAYTNTTQTTTPAATSIPVTSAKAPPTSIPVTSAKAPPTTTPVTSVKAPPITTGANTTIATTATTNHGQQVSQAAKEKTASHRDKKENNPKKM